MWTICALYSSSLDVRPAKHEDVAGWRVGPQFRALMVACASAYLSHWVYNLLSCINIPVVNTCDCFVFWLVPSLDLRDSFLPYFPFGVFFFVAVITYCSSFVFSFVCSFIYSFSSLFYSLSFRLFFYFYSSLPFLRVAPIINISSCNLTLENLRLLIMEALFHKKWIVIIWHVCRACTCAKEYVC